MAKNTQAVSDDLVPDIGELVGHQQVGQDVDCFWTPTIGGDQKRLNPLRGIPVGIKYRKAELLDPKDPSKGNKEPQAVILLKATGKFVVVEPKKPGEEKGVERLCKEGEIVWVDVRHAFTEFKEFLPKLSAKGPVAVEIAWVPSHVEKLPGNRTLYKGKRSARLVFGEECQKHKITGEIDAFLKLGGLEAPKLLLTEGGQSEETIPF